MKRHHLALAAVGAVVLLLAATVGGVVLYGEYLSRDSYGSTYDYSARFTANASLSDLTVSLPVPVEDGNVSVLGANLTVRDDSVEPPDGASLPSARIVETESGPMLALEADEFVVEKRYYRFVEADGEGRRVEINESEYVPGSPEYVAYTERAIEVTATLRRERSIDTASPIGTEPLLAPRTNQREVACESRDFDTQSCYAYDTRTFLAYDGPEDVRTSVWVELAGRNDWWVFGWNGNEYRDTVIATFDGAQSGWQTVAGELGTGWGTYLDPPAANRTVRARGTLR